jgi:hypothetical protein
MEAIERRLFEAMQQCVERAIGEAFPELWHDPTHGRGDGPEPRAVRIRSIVERGIENAVGVEITDAPDFAAFIALGIALSLTPPREAGEWIRAWIKRPETPGQAKIRMIESRLSALAKEDKTLAAIAERVAVARTKATV